MRVDSSLISNALALRVEQGVTAADVPAAVAAMWQEIATQLGPIIGKQGMAAIYRRCLHRVSTDWPWLSVVAAEVSTFTDVEPLRLALVQQSETDARAASIALLTFFNELLTSLVGTSLTDRLMRSVWRTDVSGTPEQESPT